MPTLQGYTNTELDFTILISALRAFISLMNHPATEVIIVPRRGGSIIEKIIRDFNNLKQVLFEKNCL